MKKGILLIGMPGCGKTTLGEALAKEIGFNFVDMDRFIEEKMGQSIVDIFKSGEETFRDIESENSEIVSKFHRIVVSSGGGIVKRKRNIDCFKDFIIIFINRPLDLIIGDIDVENRPLLRDKKDRLYDLYNERINLYETFGQRHILNDSTVDVAIERLKEVVNKELSL